jgi:hypothetical protein
MSQTPPTRKPAAGDKLRAFRERAAVILAGERGFTPQCRIKLARLAHELGMNEAQAEEAVRSLREKSQPKGTDPLVEKFRQRLKKDLSGRHRTVIGPEIEARVIASAQRKYGIDADTVREVLTEVAAELGLRHITGDQAAQLYADMVDEAVGDSTWLAREAWDRLRTAGEKWGLSYEESDELIEQKIAANRRESAAGRLVNRLVLGGSLAVLAIVVVALGTAYIANRDKPEVPIATGPDEAPGESPIERKKTLAQPAWWDIDLAVAMATSRREISDVAAMYDDLRADDPAVRQKAYERLVAALVKVEADNPAREQLVTLLAGCHALDPDEASAARLREALLKHVPGSDEKLSRPSTYQRAYFSVETALALLSRQGMPAARAEALASAIGAAVGTRVAAQASGREPPGSSGTIPDSQRAVQAALTRTLYRHLTAKGPTQPDEAATLQEWLSEQAAAWMPPAEIERLNSAFLVAMLFGAEQAWRTFEPLMQSLSESRDPLIVLGLLDVFRKAENKALQRTLGALLVRRTGARPRSDDPRQMARAIRQALGAAGVPVTQSAEDRWEDLRAAAEPVLARRAASPADRAAVLAETAELAGLATQAMALAQGEPGFAIFDELTRPPEAAASDGEKPEPEDPPAAADSGFRAPPVKKRPMTLPEKQALARAIGVLADFEKQSTVNRANSLRMVASRVPVTPDLTYEQALVVARYLLAPKADGESELIQPVVEQLRAWRQVRLAVADRIGESKLAPSQRDQLIGALSGSLVPPPGATADDLRQMLLKDVLADVEAGGGGPGGGETAPAAAASRLPAVEALAQTYRQRARVLAVPAAEYRAAESPPAALEMVVRVLARRGGSRGSAAAAGGPQLAHELEAVNFLAADEPQRAVLLQRVLLELIAGQVAASKPQQAAAAEKIASDLAAADAAETDLISQLRAGERATLEMWMLFAVP